MGAIQDMIRNGRDYLGIKIELFRLKVVAKVSETGASLVAMLLVFTTLLLGKLMLVAALAMYLGEKLDSYAAGFAITGGSIFLLGWFLFAVRKGAIEAPVRDRLVRELLAETEINQKKDENNQL